MDLELTPENIIRIVRAGRVLASGFAEEHLLWVTSGQKRLAESGFCEAVWALVRLERETGVTISHALDAAKKLVQDNASLETANASLEKRNATLQALSQEFERRYQQLAAATRQAEAGLAAVKAEVEKERKRLTAYREEAEKGKSRIDREVEEYRQKANVTEHEMAAAGQLKAEVERSGFSLELMLGLAKEFAGHKDAKDKLAEGIKKHGTLTGYVAAMEKEAAEKKLALDSELANLRVHADQEQRYAITQENARYSLENTINQLQVDAAYEQELRTFYEVYHGLRPFLDCLLSWNRVKFLKCNNPISALAHAANPSGMAHFCTDQPPVACPHCAGGIVDDAKIYQALNLPPGTWVVFGKGG